jgi:hypothetical protein
MKDDNNIDVGRKNSKNEKRVIAFVGRNQLNANGQDQKIPINCSHSLYYFILSKFFLRFIECLSVNASGKGSY